MSGGRGRGGESFWELIGGLEGGGGAWPDTFGLQRAGFVSISARRWGPKSRVETLAPAPECSKTNKSVRLFMNK